MGTSNLATDVEAARNEHTRGSPERSFLRRGHAPPTWAGHVQRGAGYVISRGRAMKSQILVALDIRGSLPEPANCRGGQTAVPSDISRSEEVMHLPF
jgi:hypothetical protein